MKKLLLVLFMLLLLAGGIVYLRQGTVISPIMTSAAPTVTPSQASGPVESKTSIFVPYWGLEGRTFSNEYDTLIYFGITPGESGINASDSGYTSLTSFAEKAAGKRSYLTLRMLDSKQNFRILENRSLQEALVTATIAAAKAHDFEGIVLDLEVSALPFDSLIKQISSFNTRFYEAAKKENLHYSVALYGDTYFRIRPFDVKSIARDADEVMIMAYDFHKSRGNPGPNFPLKGKDRYGYDYDALITQFSDAVPKEKLTVIFGYFGYDWEVNKEKNMVTHGVPLSYNQIAERFITDCRFSSCERQRDSLSAESFISYTDADGSPHIVWFEDSESVAKKKAFLQNKGITSFSYWAYSYF